MLGWLKVIRLSVMFASLLTRLAMQLLAEEAAASAYSARSPESKSPSIIEGVCGRHRTHSAPSHACFGPARRFDVRSGAELVGRSKRRALARASRCALPRPRRSCTRNKIANRLRCFWADPGLPTSASASSSNRSGGPDLASTLRPLALSSSATALSPAKVPRRPGLLMVLKVRFLP
jgi:hypothetical protein